MTDTKTKGEKIAELKNIIGELNRVSKVVKDSSRSVDRLLNVSSELVEGLYNDLKPTLISRSIILPPAVIIDLVQKRFEVIITKRTRKKEYVEPRHIACYLLKKYTRMSLMEIGEYTGGLDHTTVINAINNVKKFMSIESDYLDKVFDLEEQLEKIFKTSYAGNNIQTTSAD